MNLKSVMQNEDYPDQPVSWALVTSLLFPSALHRDPVLCTVPAAAVKFFY